MRVWLIALFLLSCGDDSSAPPDASRDATADRAAGDAADAADAAGPDAAVDAQPDAECAGGFHTATPGQIHCGASCCRVPGAPTFCCFLVDSLCSDSCQPGSDFYACDGPDDCGGSPCCGVIANLGTHSQCRAGATACMPGESQLCHSAADCPASASHCCLWLRSPSPPAPPQIELGSCVADPAGQQMCD